MNHSKYIALLTFCSFYFFTNAQIAVEQDTLWKNYNLDYIVVTAQYAPTASENAVHQVKVITAINIQEQGQALLAAAGYEQYEISGYAKPGYQCQHNLNYWRFGDYLGIGCGAHGKVTNIKTGVITRTEKVKHPRGYMDLAKPYLYKQWRVEEDDLAFEFFMNRFRLVESCPKKDLSSLTGLSQQSQQRALNTAIAKGLLIDNSETWQVSQKGHRYLNDLLELFV